MKVVEADSARFIPGAERDDKLSAAEFTRIYEKYFDRVYRYICYRVGCRHSAEDLCSQVFERLLDRHGSYSPDKASYEVWLFTIARNVVTDHHRRSRFGRLCVPEDEAVNIPSEALSPEALAITAESNESLYAALGKLSDKERGLIAMKFAAMLRNTEIADILGTSASAVGVKLYRILKKMKDDMTKGGFSR